jgi:hypothetical protein
MKRMIVRLSLFVLVLFIMPSLTHLAIWAASDHPASWHEADWSSANILPPASTEGEAKVYVMAARTGGLKGAISKHSWIVLKKPGANHYDRYDVVGWGKPVRLNAYPADGKWYSNRPEIQFEATGRIAAALIPKIEHAISNYRWQSRGDYIIWPGPNSNTFVASIIRSVPDFDAVLPATAIGKDFPASGKFIDIDEARHSIRLSFFGYAGIMVGPKSGLQVNILGLVTGIDWYRPALLLPGFGRVG